MTIKRNDMSKCLSFAPYCCKPMDCPVGRKNQRCIRFSGDCERTDCTIGLLIDRLGIPEDRFFVIDKDENLLEWLEDKWEEGYRFFYPGVGCNYGYEKVKDYISFTGLVVLIDGDVCDDEEHYQSMENEDKGKLTYIPMSQIDLMTELGIHY